MHAERGASRGLRRSIDLLAAFVIASLLVFSGAASAQSRYVTFDGPGAIYYTYPTSINRSGQIVVYYSDSTAHSFLRNSDGTIISFDPPGSTGSAATSINNAGEITGYWFDSLGDHGYDRSAAGDFTSFDIPSTGQEQTIPYSISDGGSIVGYYSDGFSDHGFVRDSGGTITVFDPPGSTLTIAETVNQSGFISGAYYDSASLLHGFILSPVGTYTIINVPGVSGQGTVGSIINDRGQATGSYTEGIFYYGYLRSAGGKYTTFHLSGASATEAVAINNLGQVAGIEQRISGLDAAFIRDNTGKVIVFQVPGAGLAQEENQGTAAVAINSSGTVTGYYYDTSKVPHGFIRY